MPHGWRSLNLPVCPSDDRPGSDPSRRLVLQGPVEHPGFHRRDRSAGGVCSHVSRSRFYPHLLSGHFICHTKTCFLVLTFT